MKICIYGAGAIGGYLAVELARAGADVSCIARGPHLQAIKQNGLTLHIGGESRTVQIPSTDEPAELGPQDYVIVALKAPGAHAVAERMAPLFHERTAVVTAQNGVPWWYFYKLGGPHDDTRLETVDPGGRQWTAIGPERVIGAVVYPAAEITAPGVITHGYSNRFTLGEPDGQKSERVTALSDVMTQAGFKARVRPNIRDEIWLKLWDNLCFNPISALTKGTLKQMAEDEGVRRVIRAMMVEAQAVAEALGVKFALDVDRRIAATGEVGEHKTSMLQDLEKGRTMEIDALVTAVQELGRLVELPTPTLDTVLALVQFEARLAGCYG